MLVFILHSHGLGHVLHLPRIRQEKRSRSWLCPFLCKHSYKAHKCRRLPKNELARVTCIFSQVSSQIYRWCVYLCTLLCVTDRSDLAVQVKAAAGRLFFLTPRPADPLISTTGDNLEYPLSQLVVFTEHADVIRRGGVASTIK